MLFGAQPHRIGRAVDFDHVDRFTRGDAQTFALTVGEVVDSRVLAEHRAVGIVFQLAGAEQVGATRSSMNCLYPPLPMKQMPVESFFLATTRPFSAAIARTSGFFKCPTGKRCVLKFHD